MSHPTLSPAALQELLESWLSGSEGNVLSYTECFDLGRLVSCSASGCLNLLGQVKCKLKH